ncbi:MtrAB system histidine kinase MtrB [Agilicoccus flavus]|uniref:MtrAB system histidine kinase MtrB n=1 Tax=Agilicoccus flavus TaxID=2775968 RepID=UPI001CF6B6E9|nr:MtrAB system histidine kinase MtrB [Agilicoccus flavus]
MRRAARGLALAREVLARRTRTLLRWWRANLQVRVVALTMLLGLVVIVAVQAFLYQRTSVGLVEGRIVTAREDAAMRARDIQARLDSTDQIDVESIRQFTYDLIRAQESQSLEAGREVILTRAIDNLRGPERIPTMWTDVDVGVVPTALRRVLAADPQHQQVQVITVPRGGTNVPAVIVGSRILVPQAGQQELYFVFPLDREDAIMTMMLRTFALGALVLVGLIGLVAYVVTRLVVDPVREAAAVAGRLSSGRLDERMHVSGEDELARLARAFNDMADSLQTQIRRLEDLSRLQQRFVSDVSHELRTPLTTIRMAAEVIHASRGDFAVPVARSTELLASEVDRFDELLAELLEISRYDAGGAVLERSEVDVRDVVDRVVDSCTTLARAKGSTVSVSAQARAYPCEMDTRRVERILRNLLVNALEHGEGRPVEIELADNDRAVGVAVRDHGVGLEPGQAALVFNRFWRADPARNRTTGGTGLGLAIALEDARLHGGWLQAWGRPGAGARFRLTLPRVAGETIEHAPLSLGPDPASPEPASPEPQARVTALPPAAGPR